MLSLKLLFMKVYIDIKILMIACAFLLKYILFQQCKYRHSKIWTEIHQTVDSNCLGGSYFYFSIFQIH